MSWLGRGLCWSSPPLPEPMSSKAAPQAGATWWSYNYMHSVTLTGGTWGSRPQPGSQTPHSSTRGLGFSVSSKMGCGNLYTYFYNHRSPIPAFTRALETNLTPWVGKQDPGRERHEGHGAHVLSPNTGLVGTASLWRQRDFPRDLWSLSIFLALTLTPCVPLVNHLTSRCINSLRTWIKFVNTLKTLKTEPRPAACGALSCYGHRYTLWSSVLIR